MRLFGNISQYLLNLLNEIRHTQKVRNAILAVLYCLFLAFCYMNPNSFCSGYFFFIAALFFLLSSIFSGLTSGLLLLTMSIVFSTIEFFSKGDISFIKSIEKDPTINQIYTFLIVLIAVFVGTIEKKISIKKMEEIKIDYIATEELSNIIYVLISFDGSIKKFSKAFCKLFEYEEKEIFNKNIYEILNPNDTKIINKAITDIMNSKSESRELICKCQNKNGRVFDAEITITANRSNSLIHSKFVFLIKDITENKLTEQRIRESEQRYKNLMDLLPDSVILLSENTIILENKSARKLFLANVFSELTGRNILDFIQLDSVKRFQEKIKLVETLKMPIPPVESKIVRQDGKIIEIQVSASFIQYNSQPSIVCVIRDISEIKKTEELQKKMEESEFKLNESLNYNILKTEFFSNISHDLKTPLNVIISALKLMEDQNKSLNVECEKLIKYHKIIYSNCYRLLRLVNNLIDLTKIDTNFLEPVYQNINLVEVVEETALSIVSYTKSRNIEFIFDTTHEEIFMLVDIEFLERILLNLLSNAVKFSKSGGTIKVNIKKEDHFVTIIVSDTGVGIPPEMLNSIFERFKQADRNFLSRQNGSGIGLALVKSLVELLNGQIFVKSKVNEGSDFIVRLPIMENKEAENTMEELDIQSTVKQKISLEFSDLDR